jgi:hypothetical protein
MRTLLLAALLSGPARAADVKKLPGQIVTPLVSGPAVTPPLAPPAADPALRAAALPGLGPLPQAAAAEAAANANARVPAEAKAASDPARLASAPALEAAARGEAQTQAEGERGDAAAEQSARDLVRRLLKGVGDEREQLNARFDGAKALADAGLEAPVQGEQRQTRHGLYTLAFTETRRERGLTVLLERWEGPGGGLWVEHKRGRSSWQMKEYRGKAKPGLGLPPTAYAEFELSKRGRFFGNVETAPEDGPTSVMIDAKKAFHAAYRHLSGQFEGIKGSWTFGSNLAAFNRLTGEGKTPEEAAFGTWTGQRAAELGYTKVVFSGEGLAELETGVPGKYEKMSALFLKP